MCEKQCPKVLGGCKTVKPSARLCLCVVVNRFGGVRSILIYIDEVPSVKDHRR